VRDAVALSSFLFFVFIFLRGLEMGWEGIVHGGKEYLIDEGYEALFSETACIRCVSGEGQGPDAIRGTGHRYYITLRKYA